MEEEDDDGEGWEEEVFDANGFTNRDAMVDLEDIKLSINDNDDPRRSHHEKHHQQGSEQKESNAASMRFPMLTGVLSLNE